MSGQFGQKTGLYSAVLLFMLTLFGLADCSNEPIEQRRQSLPAGSTQMTLLPGQLPDYFKKLQLIPYVSNGSRKIRAVALTFDADMTPGMLKKLRSGKDKSLYDRRIVQTLRADHIPATIFMTGMWAETYPQAVQDLAHDPLFEIENHSYDHAAFKVPCYGLADSQNSQDEIVKAEAVLMKIGGVQPKYFRFPGGCFSDKDLELVHSLGLVPIQWDIVSGDAYLKKPQGVIQQVLALAQSGSIIVFHLNGAPNAPATADALPTIIKTLKSEGYSFMTLDDLLQASIKA